MPASLQPAPYSESFGERLAKMAAKPKLDVQVCDHCNLRCAGCLHFAPLAEERFLDLGEYERDLESLADIDGIDGYFGGCFLQLARGAIWPCQVAAHHGSFARRFGYRMRISPDDMLMLGAIESAGDIESFRRRSHPMCRYCNNAALTVAPWEQSKLDARKWLA